MAYSVYLVCLLFISGVVAQDWSVKYNPTSLCALKGSTVIMGCTYTYPRGHMVVTTSWSKQLVATNFEPPDLSSDPKYRDRMKYLGDKQHDCRFQLSNVREEDQSNYYFRFITNQSGGRWQGRDGVALYVTDLQVDAPERVIEGAAVALTCKTSCNLTDAPTFIWYKNGYQLTSSKTSQIYLRQVSSEDVGSYYCSILGCRHHSTAVTLQVLYPPKNVSVSISPSGVIVEGSSVTLTCSSDANPPVDIYYWFKGSSYIGTGKVHNIEKISSVNNGQYYCSTRNDHGYRTSSAVSVDVKYPPKRVSVSISPSGIIVEGSTVTLTCSSDANPPVDIYYWFKASSYIGTGKVHNIEKISSVNNGQYYCSASNDHGYRTSSAVSVDVKYPPKRVSVSISPSGEVVENSSVNLTCSSDANPPAEYLWFKRESFVSKGDTYRIDGIMSEHSRDYKCKATNTYGEKYSVALTLNVVYPPKNVSVSISPSGEVVENSSVNLTCSSDANPPAEYLWFKRESFVSKGDTYRIDGIMSEHSGDYKCKATNTYGEKYSVALTLNVLYPPKNVSVSISPSGVIVEDSSVNLTCSSDANPPVVNYTWYKDNETSPVGSGQSYRAVESGSYYCEAQHGHGAIKAKAVLVTYKGKVNVVMYAAIGVTVGCGCLLVIIGIFIVKSRKSGNSDDSPKLRDENIYCNVEAKTTDNHPTADANQGRAEDNIPYATVRFTSTGSASRSDDAGSEEPSVIYSSVK